MNPVEQGISGIPKGLDLNIQMDNGQTYIKIEFWPTTCSNQSRMLNHSLCSNQPQIAGI